MKLFLFITLFAIEGWCAGPTSIWTEVAADQIDTKLLTARGQQALSAKEFKWRHAQTAHFVVHFENGIFAAKVSRIAEFFHDYIAADLKGLKDLAEGRSHIFIFRNVADWKKFMTTYGSGISAWSYSFVEGPVMYLQQAGDIGSSAEVLGHEMTHLVVNRFIPGRLPLWLNEGIAEWYGEFAYAEYKGVKKSRRASFRPLRKTDTVASVLQAEVYPADPNEVHPFYLFSKHLVAFLQFEKVGEFPSFLQDVAAEKDVRTALLEHYAIVDEVSFEKEFWKFAR